MHNNRRKLLALLAGGAATGSVLPEKWTRPVVKTVLLPAHAQTTTEGGPTVSIACEIRLNEIEGELIAEGTELFLSETLVIVFTVSPNPGAGALVFVEELCEGTPNGEADNLLTDANGRVAYNVEAQDPCFTTSGGPGNSAVRGTYAGVSDTCSWVTIDD